MSKNKLNYIEIFSGCNGLSEGFKLSNGYEGLAHVEWEMPMVETARKRLSNKWGYSELEAQKRVIHFDVQKTDELIKGNWRKETKDVYSKTNNSYVIENGLDGLVGSKKVDIIIGGPPCTSYSIAGRAKNKHNSENDYRNFLFESFVKVVNHFSPSIFVFENVPGLLSSAPGDKLVTQRIYDAFKEIGYEIRKPSEMKKSIYNSKFFGVPQDRKRVIIFGIKTNQKMNLEDLYSELDKHIRKDKIVTVRDAISHLPKLMPLSESIKLNGKNISHKNEGDVVIPGHEPRFHNQRDIKIFKEWVKSELNKKSTLEKIKFYKTMVGKDSNHAKYRNLDWDKPAPTIVSHLCKDGLMFIHPDSEQARSLSVAEASLLMSFPEDYEFHGSQSYNYKMIGNAVPPLMAEKIALTILKVLK
jgi:DNA (cytosine-5)-methyltransferase 1